MNPENDDHMKPFKMTRARRRLINKSYLSILTNEGSRLPGHVKNILNQVLRISLAKCDCDSIPALEKFVGGVEDYHESFSRARCISCNSRYILYDFLSDNKRYGVEDFIKILKSFNRRYNCSCSSDRCNICRLSNIMLNMYKKGLIDKLN